MGRQSGKLTVYLLVKEQAPSSKNKKKMHAL